MMEEKKNRKNGTEAK